MKGPSFYFQKMSLTRQILTIILTVLMFFIMFFFVFVSDNTDFKSTNTNRWIGGFKTNR